jgi:(p)ppGpp synthase/HD superfamily hydrolase
MHDIFEDTDLTYEDLVSEFSIDVANLIHEVTHER